jgi:uncharacterized protein
MRGTVLQYAVVGAAAVLLAGCAAPGSRAPDRQIEIGTGGTGGVYYPLGVAIAERLAAQDTLRSYTAQPTGGSLENIRRVLRGDLDFGFAIGTTVYEAYSGGRDFDAPQTRLRIVSPLHPNLTHVLVTEASGIASVAELRGRVISVGSAGSGTEQVARQLLEMYAIEDGSYDARFLPFDASVEALLAGEIEVAILSVGYPAPAVTHALASGHVRLLPMERRHVLSMADRHPYYSEGMVPAYTYPDQVADVPTVMVLNWVVARDDVDAAVVRMFVDLLHREQDLLREAASLTTQINLTNLFAAPIPLHPAVRTWLGEGGDTAEAVEDD